VEGLRVIFLGTGGGLPTTSRGLPSVVIKRKGELIFFDCGEGTQRQMLSAKIGFCKKTKIFISHLHGDHIFGILGLMQTMALLNRNKSLQIYGPKGIREFIEAGMHTTNFGDCYVVEVFEVESGLVCEEKEYKVYATWADHVQPNLSYALVEDPRPGRFHPERAKALRIPQGKMWSRLQHGETITLSNGKKVKPEDVLDPKRPGRKIVYSGDTKPSKAVEELAENADLLIHEATFDDELTERAGEDSHSTATQAAKVAKNAKVKMLILTHISARYKDPMILLHQAEKIFPHVTVAKDFMEVNIPYSR